MSQPNSIPNLPDPARIRAVVFDLDGTLYDQRTLRRKMALRLVIQVLRFRMGATELKIIRQFRKEREKHPGYSSAQLDAEQYQWCAEALGIAPNQVKTCIEQWMYRFPLKLLRSTRYPNAELFLHALHACGIKRIIYSDYPVEAKMNALQLPSDGQFCSTTAPLHQLKPSKTNLDTICQLLNCLPEECLYVGDRDDTDGQGARSAGMPFILVDTHEARKGIFYKKLTEPFNLTHEG